jgi:hypothetical protein
VSLNYFKIKVYLKIKPYCIMKKREEKKHGAPNWAWWYMP